MTRSPLRLAIDLGPLYGHRTGIGVAVQGMVDAFADRDDVELHPYLVSFRSDPRHGHRKLPLPGIAASHLWSRFDRPSADRWLGDADVVHGTNYVAPPTSLPTVVSVYDCWFLQHPELAGPVVRRAGAALRRAVARGAWVHSSSDATTAQARELLETDRVVTVHLGAPETPPPLSQLTRPAVAGDLDGRPFVLAIASEEHRKDLPVLIAAFRVLAQRHPDVHLVLAGGPGNQTDGVVAALDELPSAAKERTHRLGVVDDMTKHWLLRQASALAYPSLDEGFGFPILEAQSVGTPVVASRGGSIPEIAGDGCAFVDERHPDALADRLDEVITSGTVRLGLIEAGHRNLNRFTWERTVDGLVDLYQRARTDP